MNVKSKAAPLKFVRNTCKSPAAWRLQVGKPSEHLSPYYRLGCEHGTEIAALWKMGGSEPVYLCETHAQALGTVAKDDATKDKTDIPAYVAPAPQANDANGSSGAGRASGARTVLSFGLSLGLAEGGSKTPVATEKVGSRESTSPATVPQSKDKPAEKKMARPATALNIRSTGRDVAFGDAAKALVDEVIWNLAVGDLDAYFTALGNGKSPSEAAKDAGGQIAVVHRKISEYTGKLGLMLSKSAARIDIGAAIDKPLELAMLNVINDEARNDAEKDAAIQQLGAIQEWVKRISVNGSRRWEIDVSEAWEILRAIGERMNWGGASDIPEVLKPVYRDLYTGLKKAIVHAAPLAGNIQGRLENLYAAKSDIENVLAVQAGSTASAALTH